MEVSEGIQLMANLILFFSARSYLVDQGQAGGVEDLATIWVYGFGALVVANVGTSGAL